MIRKTAIVAVLAALLCLASLSPLTLAQPPCDHQVLVYDVCCDEPDGGRYTLGWFYNGTDWVYSKPSPDRDWTYLFGLEVDGVEYYGYCINYTAPLELGDEFNASIYSAEPSCKNNSIAYILNNWTHVCGNCDIVSAAQSAIWYFWYINESLCGTGSAGLPNPPIIEPEQPGWESYWIPNCSAHPLACEFINEAINKSVPYNITLSPSSGDYTVGTPLELTATVEYCLEAVGAEVTVVFETDCGTFVETASPVYENDTVNGIAKAHLDCDGDSANVTASIKDMKWFEIVDATGCEEEVYQETLRIINVTDPAMFTFSEVTTKEVEGYVYEDWSCNCTYDAGEKGVPDVTVELVNVSTGLVVNTTTTDINGYYNFTDVPVGLYTVRYDTSTLPSHLDPRCDDDSSADGIPAINTSDQFNGIGTHWHNFSVEALVEIEIEKLVNGLSSYTATRNETVMFTLNITNTGEANLTNLTVTDVLPDGLSWADDANPGEDSVIENPDGTTTIVWMSNLTLLDPFEPGEWVKITFNATVDPGVCGMFKDVADVTANSSWCSGITMDNDDAYVFVECTKVPVLTPFGIAALIGLLGLVVVLTIRRIKR